jgi:hypothetical protein
VVQGQIGGTSGKIPKVLRPPPASASGFTLWRAAWVSADMLYRNGGETTTDGRADHNPTRGWSAGLSGALRIAPKATVILTYEHVVERSDQGPDGWFFRTALVVPFR